jgi:molybdenum cofactor biosynthesis enzyme MoaA
MKIQFEASTSCNANCKFCPRSDITRPKGQMSDELFKKIIAESKAFQNTEIVPFLNGEPFIFPRIWEWLDYMRDNDCRVYIFTNAEFIDVDRIVKYPNIRYICCSINAATKETHQKIMRGPNYDKVVANVEDLIKKAPFPVYVSMVVTSDNQHEFEAFKQKWGKRVMHGEFKNWGGARHDALEKTGERKPCISLLRAMTILWDGRAVICCLDYDGKFVIGDANKQTLSELLLEYKKLWKRHNKLDFNYEPCRECNQNI